MTVLSSATGGGVMGRRSEMVGATGVRLGVKRRASSLQAEGRGVPLAVALVAPTGIFLSEDNAIGVVAGIDDGLADVDRYE